MKIRRKLVILVIFFVMFSFNVKVEAVGSDIDNNVLDEYSSNISFLENKMAVIKGALNKNLIVKDVVDSIDLDSLNNDYNINKVYVKDLFDNELSVSDGVVSGYKLIFEGSSETDSIYIEYIIMVVGDINNDGFVNEMDVTSMVDNLLNYGNYSVINDINGDLDFNVLDATYLLNSLNVNSWDNIILDDIKICSYVVSNTNVFINDEFEVKYVIQGFDSISVNGLSGILDYDKNLLELINVDIDNKYGYINKDGNFLYLLNGDGSDEVVLTFKFKAVNEGNVRISFNDMIFSANGYKLDVDSDRTYTDVVVSKYGTGGDGNDNSSDNDLVWEDSNTLVSDGPGNVNLINYEKPVVINIYDVSRNVVTYVKISGDNYIKELEIDGYNIEFDRDVLEYSIKVGSNIEKLNLNIILNDLDARYEVVGNDNFKSGKNVVSIFVTAADGSERVYTINVNKDKKIVSNVDNKDSNTSRIVIIILIILVIIGLIYVIFKDDEEEEKENRKEEKK